MKNPARLVAFAGLACSLASVVILHFLRTDLQPVRNRLSEYANGPYGWLMTVAFLSVGLAIIALGGVLRASARSDVRARLIQATSLVAGVGLVVSGVFRTGVTPVSEEIHSSASGLGTIALVGMSLAYSLPLLHEGSRFRGYFGWALALTATGVAAISPVLHETRWTGLSQRMLWAVLVIWLLWASLDSGPAGVRRLTP